jgi:hypothetical protein
MWNLAFCGELRMITRAPMRNNYETPSITRLFSMRISRRDLMRGFSSKIWCSEFISNLFPYRSEMDLRKSEKIRYRCRLIWLSLICCTISPCFSRGNLAGESDRSHVDTPFGRDTVSNADVPGLGRHRPPAQSEKPTRSR